MTYIANPHCVSCLSIDPSAASHGCWQNNAIGAISCNEIHEANAAHKHNTHKAVHDAYWSYNVSHVQIGSIHCNTSCRITKALRTLAEAPMQENSTRCDKNLFAVRTLAATTSATHLEHQGISRDLICITYVAYHRCWKTNANGHHRLRRHWWSDCCTHAKPFARSTKRTTTGEHHELQQQTKNFNCAWPDTTCTHTFTIVVAS